MYACGRIHLERGLPMDIISIIAGLLKDTKVLLINLTFFAYNENIYKINSMELLS